MRFFASVLPSDISNLSSRSRRFQLFYNYQIRTETLSPSAGVGAAMVTLSLIVSIYYNVIMCYTLFFTFASFQGGEIAPWSECNMGEQ